MADRAGAVELVEDESDPPAREEACDQRCGGHGCAHQPGQVSPSLEWAARMRRRVTFSRNLTLSLSRTCRCYCKYCAFATHQAHLHAPDEVIEMLDRAVERHHVKELLVLTGEKPEVNAGVAARLGEYGYADFVSYVVWACERALERGVLPHTNLGVLGREDLARLREVTASQGLMLESINPDLVVHQGSPTKHPARRVETIAAAGELKIPFTTGILVGIGETEEERFASLEAIAKLHERHGHIQEVILQNYVPHQNYYGREPAEIADAATREYWRTGVWDGPHLDAPEWACEVTLEDMKRLVREARRLMPGVGIQVPPNLCDWWIELVRAGATDLGGLSANGDHISPEHPVPVAERSAQAPARRRTRAVRAAVRLPRVHRPRVDLPAGDGRDQGHVLVLHPASRVRPDGRSARGGGRGAARDRARTGGGRAHP